MSKYLDEAVKYIKEKGLNIYRIAEIHNGKLEYVELSYANPCQNTYSTSKAFTATAVGMLWDRGMLSLDEKVVDIFADCIPENTDPRWASVTVEHLLTHYAGFGPGQLDIDCQDASEYGTDDYLSLLFTTPLHDDPGTKSVYSDAAFYMLSRIVSKKLGEPMDDFMWRELFYPCKVREAAWSKCPKGYPMGATGLYIRAEDVAKHIQLYLTGGVYEGRRYLSEEWVKLAVKNGYGINLFAEGKLYYKGGMRGQMSAFVPEKNRAIAWTGCDDREMWDLLYLAIDMD